MELRRSKNVATYIVAPIVDADGDIVTGATGLDSELNYWDDGNAPQTAFSDCTNEATEIGSTGIYYLSLTQAEMNHDYVYVIIKTSTSGAKSQHVLINCKNQPADVLAISGDATAADNCELMFDGTGYAGGTTKLDVNAVTVEGTDATNAIRDAVVDDATRIDASALNTLSSHDPGEAIMGATDIGTGSGLSAIPWNAAWDAEVQSECADALAAYDPPTKAELDTAQGAVTVAAIGAGAITAAAIATNAIDADAIAADAVTEIQSGLATAAALDAVDNFVDTEVAAIVSELAKVPKSDGSASWNATALAAIQSEAADAITAAGLATDADVAAAVWSEAVPGAYAAGTAGKVLGDNLNATVSSRATQTSVDTIDDYVDTEVAAILAIAQKLDTALELDGAVYRFTTNALEQAPSGGGSLTAQQVWEYATRALTDKAGFGLANGAITAAVVATDAIDGDAIAASAVTEVQSGLATSAEVTALNDLDAAGVQAAAAAALTAYDPPTRTEATSDKNEVLAALPSSGPSAATIADAVWDEALAGHAAAGSAGAALTGAGVAGDPWTAALPGDYEAGTAGAILPALESAMSVLGAGDVTVTSPVAASGAVTIYAGDDYDATHGRSISFDVADATHALGLDDPAAVVRFKCSQATWTGTATSTATGYTVAFEPTDAQTASLTIARQSYELEATLADGDVVTLATGTLVVVRDIPAV